VPPGGGVGPTSVSKDIYPLKTRGEGQGGAVTDTKTGRASVYNGRGKQAPPKEIDGLSPGQVNITRAPVTVRKQVIQPRSTTRRI